MSEEPTIYVYGEEVKVRGVERRHAEDMSMDFEMWVHVDWVNEPKKTTSEVHLSRLKTEGGLSALNDYLLERGLVPQWWVDGKQSPDQ